ncbi:FAD synthetase [Neobacillus vireti]|uniref:FAD synthetase n=1 Tax=Neobacillus vireti TaxID=220686 RepID=UPI002FFF018B
MGVPSVVYTFDPPPRIYFNDVKQLTLIEEKVKRIHALGVDHVVVAQFNKDYLNRSVQQFINDLLAFHPIEIIVGSDFRFGKNRSGGIEELKQYFQVYLMDSICCAKGNVISSTRIRELLLSGKKKEAEILLNW